jgi:translation initiation factor eIF-2B subunit beta
MSFDLGGASQRSVEILASKLRRRLVLTILLEHILVDIEITRQIVGSRAAALETLLVLRQVVSKARFSNMDQLVEIIRTVGRRLVDAQPKGSL